ncbi:hypothetical protein [Flavobacterium sp.]|uniref:hypothetical protein n=1 Tax=Flavobacterium sp. TaxID=239 RepID=UPI00262D7F45|nr:hypothetical protein [Flavobacterium sp.]
MRFDFKLLIAFIFCFQIGFSQENHNTSILKVILSKYYANEKVIVKNRLQFLSFYCNKAPNNEEVLEAISKNDLLKKNASEIKKQINDKSEENWLAEYNTIFATENAHLKSKVNNCLSLEEFQKVSTKNNVNYQRLMIVGKPMYFAQKYCLIKVAFYRNIEHNSSRFLLFENINGVWTIVETINEWET